MKRFFLTLCCVIASALTASAQLYPDMELLPKRQQEGPLYPMQKEKTGLWGFATENGKFVIKPLFDKVDQFRAFRDADGNQLALARVYSFGKEGLLNRNGTYQILPLFDSIDNFVDGIALCQYQGKAGLVSIDGRILAKGYDKIELKDKNGLFWYYAGDRLGALDTEGNVVFRPAFETVPEEPLTGDYLLFRRAGKLGIVSIARRNIFVDALYDSIYLRDDFPGKIFVKKDGLIGIMDGDCVFSVRPSFDSLYRAPGQKDLVLVTKDGLVGCLNAADSLAIKPQFEDIRPIPGREDLALTLKDGKYGISRLTSGELLLLPFMDTVQDGGPSGEFYYWKHAKNGFDLPYRFDLATGTAGVAFPDKGRMKPKNFAVEEPVYLRGDGKRLGAADVTIPSGPYGVAVLEDGKYYFCKETESGLLPSSFREAPRSSLLFPVLRYKTIEWDGRICACLSLNGWQNEEPGWQFVPVVTRENGYYFRLEKYMVHILKEETPGVSVFSVEDAEDASAPPRYGIIGTGEHRFVPPTYTKEALEAAFPVHVQ